MTIRITRDEGMEGGRTVVRVEGRLTLHAAGLLEEVCAAAAGGPAAVDVDLTGVDFLDGDAARVVRGLMRLGARVERAGYFVRRALESEA